MKRTTIYLDDRQTAMRDRLAVEEGASRAEVIRRLIDRYTHPRSGTTGCWPPAYLLPPAAGGEFRAGSMVVGDTGIEPVTSSV